MRVVLVCLLLSSFLCGNFSYGKVPEKEITEIFNQRLNDLTTPEAFKKFVADHTNLFPDHTKENPSMVVEREGLIVNDETFTLAIGYRQVAIDSKNADFIKSLWAAPELFKKIYNLDGESKVAEADFNKNKFKARIYKKVPAIEDQDYTLEYTSTTKAPYTFIRAKLVKDEKGFALRDNLKVLEETKDGLIIREISYLYPLRWYVRALGPTTRSMMKKEMNKISLTEKRLTEESTNFPPSDELIEKCIKN
ncbi:MAG: hypothetical protein V4596_06690 [Bdellovibrionota bacterium]